MPAKLGRWRLPGREHWLILIGVAAFVFFAFGFVELTFTRQNLLARRDQVLSKVARIGEQNTRVQSDLTREQEGEHLPDRAFAYFGQTPRGAGVIIAEPERVEPTQMAPTAFTARDPIWVALWKRLVQALTNR